MFLRTAAKLLLSASVLVGSAIAHNIQLPAHGRECFHENLHREDRMTVTFQVGDREFGSSGNLDIDFWITNPAGGFEVNEKSISNGDFSFEAKHDGKYLYCFGNEHWGAHSKEVSFNVHGIVYVSEADAPQDPLEVEVRKLSEMLERVKDEQSYIVVRERTHRNTAESTNSRVKWWNLFVIGIVIGESVFQVWWLRRFFEVKRVV
ncbi:emp24/gp25L/p24 family/GOLD-domain-containing protein [Apiosordaria backusii]|uniref:Emp24/gp25L/p24 family/GOLD-domain-containing protein n=1 Tax=Apiosordaria backusii TaxID=314023 RepID=A0AA40K7D1_9PEZI|nr:emp24/gp25L/p24 family/GOLD-domain-containing protein [Apiosordaria backusii]